MMMCGLIFLAHATSECFLMNTFLVSFANHMLRLQPPLQVLEIKAFF